MAIQKMTIKGMEKLRKKLSVQRAEELDIFMDELEQARSLIRSSRKNDQDVAQFTAYVRKLQKEFKEWLEVLEKKPSKAQKSSV